MAIGPEPALTIYTDASFHLETGIGSWGAVIRGMEEEVHLSGFFPEPCANSEQAELQAIAKALHHVQQAGQLWKNRRVRVFTDNRACFQNLNGTGKFKRNRQAMLLALRWARKLADRDGAQVTFHWVQGHQLEGQSVHGDANRIADKLARAAHPHVPTVSQRRSANKARRRAEKAAAKAAAGEANVQRIIALANAQQEACLTCVREGDTNLDRLELRAKRDASRLQDISPRIEAIRAEAMQVQA